jgi:ribosome recycling factor
VSGDDTQGILAEASQKMDAAVEHTQGEFAKIRTGRANPQLVTDLPVDYYGTKVPLQQIAGVSVPEPRMLVINPYDQNALKEIERAIAASDLGINPSSDGQVVRVVFPELTEERRKEFVRLARERAEEGRIAIRNVRRHAKSEVSDLLEDSEVTEDEAHRADKQLQDITDAHTKRIDTLLENKEQELLEV